MNPSHANARRRVLQGTAALLAGALATPAALAQSQAQAWPTKPVKIIVGFPAGGPLDAHARLLADKLAAQLGQPVIIDYKAGAGGTAGADFVARSESLSPTAPRC